MSPYVSLILAGLLLLGSQIDIASRRLPDIVTLLLVVIGLGLQLAKGIEQFWLGLVGAAVGFSAFWLVAALYRRTRGSDGLGLGDAKLLAGAGAWLGPAYLAPVVFVSAMLALLSVGVMRLRGATLTAQTTVPFGPFLSIAFFGFWCAKATGWSWT